MHKFLVKPEQCTRWYFTTRDTIEVILKEHMNPLFAAWLIQEAVNDAKDDNSCLFIN